MYGGVRVTLFLVLLAAIYGISRLAVDGGPCDCCNPYLYYYYLYHYHYYYYHQIESVLVCCCPNRIPKILHVTFHVSGSCGTFGIDGTTIEIVWDGIDSWYGETATSGCTSCTGFFARLRCITDPDPAMCVWQFNIGFFGDAPNPSPPPDRLPCNVPAAPPIPECAGSSVPFDCDTLTAQLTNKYFQVDVNFVPHCCDATPEEGCVTIVATLTA
jgi:hypothetical protein